MVTLPKSTKSHQLDATTDRNNMTKLPKLLGRTQCYTIDGVTHSGPTDYFTEAQMMQFRRDALEEAANAIVGTYGGITAVMCSNLVRKLMDET
jgi:hypothetical protein